MEKPQWIDQAIALAWQHGPNLVISVALLLGGLWLIKRLSLAFRAFLTARKVDPSLTPFFSSMVDTGMKVALLLVVAGRMGFETTSFIAIFSALAFAIGLALQGSLGNFASGVLVLLFRPYRVGDEVTVDGMNGTVTEIQIFNTLLTMPNGKTIIMPNGKMTEGAIETMQMDNPVRADVEIHVKDNTPIGALRAISEEAVKVCPNGDRSQPPFVEIVGFPGDAIKVVVGCWTTGRYYWETFYFLHEQLKKNMDAANIKMAQTDYEH
jgi:small conductance mechanosensitive channel